MAKSQKARENAKLREARAAAALRENLKRRKKQQQAWAGMKEAAPGKQEKD